MDVGLTAPRVTRTLAPVDRVAGRRDGYDAVLAEGLGAATLLVGPLFLLLAGWHLLALPDVAGPVMSAVAGATAVLLLTTSALLRRRTVSRGRAHLLGAGLAVAVFANVAVQYALTEQPYLGVNTTLVLVGIGVSLLDPRWVAGLVVGVGAAWLAVVAATTSAAAALASAPTLVLGAVLAGLANVVRLGTLHRLLDTQAELRALSQRDELTGLLNRRGFLDAAQARLDRGRAMRVWFADVDGLKSVNDAHGHDVGDVLLVAVATALAEVFSGGIVARLAGDEFAVVEDHGTDSGVARAQAALTARLAVAAEATGLPVSVSTGVATARAGQSLSEVLSAADAAMYRTKRTGRTIRLPQGAASSLGG